VLKKSDLYLMKIQISKKIRSAVIENADQFLELKNQI